MTTPLLRTLTAAYPGPTQPRRAHFVESLHRALAQRSGADALYSHVVAPRQFPDDPTFELRHDLPVHRFIPPQPRSKGPRVGSLPKEGHWSPLALWRYLQRGRACALEHWNELQSPGCVLAHWVLPTGYLAIPVAKRLRLPLILLAHGTDLHTLGLKPWVRPFLRYTLRRATCTIVVSHELARLAARVSGLEESAFPVIPMGIDAVFQRVTDRPPPAPWNLLYVGDALASKGVPQLVAAVAALRGEGLDVTLQVVSPQQPLNLGSRSASDSAVGVVGGGMESPEPAGIEWLGALDADAVQRAMSRAHYLVHPSSKEGTPLVVQEAIANGLPVLACDVGGIPDLFPTPQQGWIRLRAPVTISSLTEDLRQVVMAGKESWRRQCEHVARIPSEPLRQPSRAAQLAALLQPHLENPNG